MAHNMKQWMIFMLSYDMQIHLKKCEYRGKVQYFNQLFKKVKILLHSRLITRKLKCFKHFSVLILIIMADSSKKIK